MIRFKARCTLFYRGWLLPSSVGCLFRKNMNRVKYWDSLGLVYETLITFSFMLQCSKNWLTDVPGWVCSMMYGLDVVIGIINETLIITYQKLSEVEFSYLLIWWSRCFKLSIDYNVDGNRFCRLQTASKWCVLNEISRWKSSIQRTLQNIAFSINQQTTSSIVE